MDLLELVEALRSHDGLRARQWVIDAGRVGLDHSSLPRPTGVDRLGLAIAAGVVELPASRAGQEAPSWTASVPALDEPFHLVRAAATMPRLRRLFEEEGALARRSRGLLAPPEFLTAA